MVTDLDPAFQDDPAAMGVIEALRELVAANRQLSLSIAGDSAIVPKPLQFRLIRGEHIPFMDHVSNMLSLGFDESGSVTRNPFGLLVASSSCLDAARQVNAAKDRFADACRAFLKGRYYPTGRKLLSRIFQSERMFTISLRQAYRHLIVCDKPIARIGFTVARKGRSITSITAEEAIVRLTNSIGEEHAARCESVVRLFERSGAPFYRVWSTAERLSANITFEDDSSVMLHAHSIILTPYGKYPIQSNVNTDAEWDVLFSPRIRSPRKDRRISDCPIMPGSHVHSTFDFDHLCVKVAL